MTQEYKAFRNMTDAEIGALVRAKNEGKVIEVVDSLSGAWVPAPMPGWHPHATYRVRHEPVHETIVMFGEPGFAFSPDMQVGDTHRITFDLIDGEPDCDSIKMEPM